MDVSARSPWRTGLLRGHVAVGMVTSHSVDLPSLLAGFHRDHPGVEIRLTEANSDELTASLRAGRLDAAIVSLGPTPPSDLDHLVVADEAIAAAVAVDHGLAGRSQTTLAALRELPLISLPPGTGIRSHLDAACAKAGFVPRIAFQASDPVVLAQLAARRARGGDPAGLGRPIPRRPAPVDDDPSRVTWAARLRLAIRRARQSWTTHS